MSKLESIKGFFYMLKIDLFAAIFVMLSYFLIKFAIGFLSQLNYTLLGVIVNYAVLIFLAIFAWKLHSTQQLIKRIKNASPMSLKRKWAYNYSVFAAYTMMIFAALLVSTLFMFYHLISSGRAPSEWKIEWEIMALWSFALFTVVFINRKVFRIDLN